MLPVSDRYKLRVPHPGRIGSTQFGSVNRPAGLELWSTTAAPRAVGALKNCPVNPLCRLLGGSALAQVPQCEILRSVSSYLAVTTFNRLPTVAVALGPPCLEANLHGKMRFMSLPMTYSRRKRLREQNGEAPVFRNRNFGNKLLTQIFQIISDLDVILGFEYRVSPDLVIYLRKERGVLSLNSGREFLDELRQFLLDESNSNDEVSFDLRLDVVELACKLSIEKASKKDHLNIRSYSNRILASVQSHVATLNARMLEDGFGFQYERGQLIELTSQFAYKEVIEPALGLISRPAYKAVNAEFRDALEEFKQGNYDDCIADCGNAFESTLKIIAKQKNWDEVSENDTANKLIDAAFRRELVPSYMQNQFNGLRSIIGGASTVRNREGGHGAGTAARVVDRHLAAYQLQQTAGVITFLVACAET